MPWEADPAVTETVSKFERTALVAYNSEMGVEERASRGAMQGVNARDACKHREHSQRHSARRIARTATSDFTVMGR